MGLPVPNLITSPAYALQVVVIVSLWSHFGYNLLLFGAALPQPAAAVKISAFGAVAGVTMLKKSTSLASLSLALTA